MSGRKKYDVTIQFETVSIRVSASDKHEAKRKAIDRVKSRNLSKLIDQQNTWVDRAD